MTSGARRCVYCRQHDAVPAFHPFCSERCKMADLGQWLTGTYVVAGPAPGGDDDEDGAMVGLPAAPEGDD